MVELVEYIVAFAVSAGVAGAAVVLFHGAMPGLQQVASQSTADQIASAARLTVIEGRNQTGLVLPLQQTTLSCSGGTLDVKMGGGTPETYGYDVGSSCSWAYQGLSGACDLLFSEASGSLSLKVSC